MAHRAAIRASRECRKDRSRARRFLGWPRPGGTAKIRRRLGVSPAPVTLWGPVMMSIRHAARRGEHGVPTEIRIDLVNAGSALAIDHRDADRVRTCR